MAIFVNKELLNEITQAIGQEAVDKLHDLKGGRRFVIPQKIGQDHWLARAIGLEAATKLASIVLVGTDSIALEFPMGGGARTRKKREAIRLIKEGELCAEDIGMRLGISRRTVHRYSAEFKRQRRERLAALAYPKPKGT